MHGDSSNFVLEEIRQLLFLFAFQVTCPGTFLRDYGYVYLKVNCMGLEVITKSVAPTFPLFFHERLRFERVRFTLARMQSNLTLISSAVFFAQFIHFEGLHDLLFLL